jgi:hypothetical protein
MENKNIKLLEELKDLRGQSSTLTNTVIDYFVGCCDTDEELTEHVNNIINYGASDGNVGVLIYNADVEIFYNTHYVEIDEISSVIFQERDLILQEEQDLSLQDKVDAALFAFETKTEELARKINILKS